MFKETVVKLKIASITDVYSLDEIKNFFDIRHISYQIVDGVSIHDENGDALVNEETKEPIVVKRLVIPEISSVQIILDEAKREDGEAVYHIVIIGDVDDKLYPVTLDAVFDAVMKTHQDSLMPYYMVNADVAVPNNDGWYMCILKDESVKNVKYDLTGFETSGEVKSWLMPSSAIKVTDTISDRGSLFIRNEAEDDYVAVNLRAFDLLTELMLTGDD